jgi:rod shape-determining protein MreD
MRNVFAVLLTILLVILQSTLLNKIAIKGVKPDLSLLAMIYLSNKNGKMLGQTLGFCSGLVEDFLSVSPLGFNGFIKTLIGFLFGLTEGTFFIDSVIIPMAMSGVATLLKGFMSGAFPVLYLENLPLPFFLTSLSKQDTMFLAHLCLPFWG